MFTRFRRRCYRFFFGRPSPDDWRIFKIQAFFLLLISVLLYLPFPGSGWRGGEEGRGLHVMHDLDELSWFIWLMAAPFILQLVRHYPLEGERLGENLGRMSLACAAIYFLVGSIRYCLLVLIDRTVAPGSGLVFGFDDYTDDTIGMLPHDILTFCGFFAVSYAVEFYFKLRQRSEEARWMQLRAAQLQADLTRAELAALRSQLHPHFLFNSFNALATLVRQQRNDAAVETIAQLGDLLRMAIERTGLQEIPLQSELDFIRRYLEIEQVRFGDKLRIEFAVAADALDALVPNIVLQPLVENAIKHGISLRTTPGTVRITATRAENRLRIEIADDGPAQAGSNPRPKRTGIGLANSRAQLTKLYGADYYLELVKQSSGGTVVSLNLPLRLAPATKIS